MSKIRPPEIIYITTAGENCLSISRWIVTNIYRFKDSVNAIGMTVHDTFATQITFKSLSLISSSLKELIHSKVEKHFGLDKREVLGLGYNSFRFIRIWFFYSTITKWLSNLSSQRWSVLYVFHGVSHED